MSNPFAHIEIRVRDASRAADFYGSLFDWKIGADPRTGYVMVDAGQAPAGGIFQAPADMPIGVTVYVKVNDLDAALAKAESLGGRTVTGRQEVPGMGWWALFSDPDGNVVGLWERMPGT